MTEWSFGTCGKVFEKRVENAICFKKKKEEENNALIIFFVWSPGQIFWSFSEQLKKLVENLIVWENFQSCG